MEEQIRSILKQMGENPERQGLLKTPQRVAESLKYLTDGYQMDLQTIVNGAIFDDAVDEMVLVRDIEIYSLCEHHLLPFVGRAHVAYIPRGRIIGLSKLPRICDMFSRRLQVQERLTQQIANAIQEVLNPWGVGVILDARHFCMMMRGVQKQNSSTVTSCMLGQFRKDPKTRTEFLRLIGHVQNDGW